MVCSVGGEAVEVSGLRQFRICGNTGQTVLGSNAAKGDPVAFRLRHIEDTRARDVIQMAAERFGWAGFQRARNRGRGFAFARYKNYAAYAAVAPFATVNASATAPWSSASVLP